MEEQTKHNQGQTKFCKFCGEKIPVQAVICPHCGGQVEELKYQQPNNGIPGNIVINNNNQNTNTNINSVRGCRGKECNKWVALVLCILFGFFGAHKFYEGRTGMGFLYLFTCGLFMIGVIADIIIIAFKPVIYYT